MTRSDIGTILVIYATCLLFFYMTLQLKPAAQIYPMCLIAALALLNTLYLLRCLLKMFRAKAVSGHAGVINDLPEIFKGFLPSQFIFVTTACVAYMFLLHWLGFYIAGAIYLLTVLYYLKVRPIPMAITLAFLGILIYCVFTLFLKVPLPKGILLG